MTVPNDDYSKTTTTADADLILRTRSGDRGAFGELWRRHYPSGMAVARSVTSSIDADDLVQESYTRIYQAILKGGGPNGSFRAYLFTSIRNTAAAWGRSRREMPIDELDTFADPDSTEQAADEALDRGLTAQAFRSLPTRWQEVLWYTEIEQMKPAEVAPLLGMKAGAVSQLAFRAREGLREAWIQAHLRNAEDGSECRWTIEHLGAYSRGNLSTRDRKRLDQHLNDCARCMIVAAEAKDVSGRLALVLLPLVLGIAGAAGYAATLQGTAPVVALAAMPSSVFDGAVVANAAGVGAGTAGVSPDGGSSLIGGSAAGSSTGGVTGGAITGIGALVGAGSAALVVAGVIAAAAIVPGLVNANPATSLPNAGEAGSSIASEVEPDADADETFLLEIAEEAPKPPAQDDEDPEVELRINEDAPVTEPAPPAVAQPTAPEKGDAEGNDAVEPSEPEQPPVEPIEPPVEPPVDPPVDPTDPEQPTDPAPGDGGDTDPTVPDPEPEPEPEPVLPTGTPEWLPATQACLPSDDSWLPQTQYTIPLTGVADATVVALVDGPFNDRELSTTLDANGSGKLVFKPTGDQILLGTITLFYVLGDERGETVTEDLSTVYSGAPCLRVDEPAASTQSDSASAPVEETAPIETDPAIEPVVQEPSVEEPVAEEAPAEEALTEEPPAEDTTPAQEPAPADEATAPAE